VFGDHGLGGLLEEGAHGKSPKCLGGNLGDLGRFCKGFSQYIYLYKLIIITEYTMQSGNKVCGNKKAQRIYFTFNR